MTEADPFHLSIGEAARLVGVSPATLRAWERDGLAQPERSPSGYRRYTLAEVEELRRIRSLRKAGTSGRPAPDLATAAAAHGGEHRADASDGARPEWPGRLKELRQGFGWSLRQVGERTGLSPSFVSAIERGRANPSIAALQKLTAAYGTSIVDLMEEPMRPKQGLVRVADRQRYDASPGVAMEQLNFGDRVMEMHLFTVDPGAGTGGAYQHEGEEFIFMLAGRLAVWIDAVEHYVLEAGDVLYFESMRPHEWTNPCQTPAVFLGVNTPRTF